MDINTWLDAAIADAKRRGIPELEPLLRALAKSTEALRRADFAEQPDAIVDELAASSRGSDASRGNARHPQHPDN
jgi:hypothetical protein